MPHTLLLADDSVTIQRVIELTFADEDVQVVAVSDGDQAIERLNANPPDIVLADIGMPGKSGYEVARYIRLSPRLQHIPVVLLTGAFEPVDQERAAEAGCDGVLAKPFEPQLVIARVRELLARSSKSPGQARAAVARPEASAALPQPAPAAPPASAPPAAAGSSADKTADYFDQLDAAFATLSNASATQSAPLSAPPPNAPSRSAEEIDWFASQLSAPAPATEMWDLPGPAAASELADLPLSTIEVPSVVAELDVTLPETGAEVPGAEVLGAARGAQVPSAPAPPQHVTSAHPAPEHVAPRHPAPHPAPPHPAP
ncbi:MAG: response regulator, partial [Acidobacteria bacterium]|nr:response regulator [Acidobacteriota bacterium]